MNGHFMERMLKHPKTVIGVLGIVTVFFALQLPRVQLDNNNFKFVPKNDPARLASQRIDDTFGSQIVVLVGLERKYETVLEPEFLLALRAFDREISKMEVVDSVTSLATTDYIGGSADGIVVDPLVPEDFSGSPEEIRTVRDRILEWDLYQRALVSEDFKSTQLLITLGLSSEEAGTSAATAVYDTVKKLVPKAGFKDTNFYITGLPVFSAVVNDAMEQDLVILIPLVVLVVLGALYLSFRRAGGIILPLLTVLVATIWSVGAMVLFGVKLTIISTVLPVILVAVGSAYGIHVVSHYYDEMAGGKVLSDAEHSALILAVMRRIGAPVFLAALTTFAGFGSLCFTSVLPIRDFGIFSSFGVVVAYGVAITLIPALLVVRGPGSPKRAGKKAGRMAEGAGSAAADRGPATAATGKARDRKPDSGNADSGMPGEDALSRAITGAFMSTISKRRSVIALALIATGLSVAGISRLTIDNVLIEYFKADNDIVRSDNFIRRAFAGSKSLSLVVTGEKPGDVLRPDVLSAMDELELYLNREVPEVGKVTGFQDLVKRINQVFNADEDPQGIVRTDSPGKPGGPVPAQTDPGFGFGTGTETGFGFGFGDASGATTGSGGSGTGTGSGSKDRAIGAETIDRLRLIQLLSDAVASSGSPSPSAADLTKALAKSINYKGAAYYEIPSDPARYGKATMEELKLLISNYLVLLSGNLSAWADDPLEPTSVRMNIQLRTVGQVDTDKAIASITGFVEDRFPKDVKTEIGGTALVEASLNRLVVNSQLTSVASSLLMVFLILALYYRSVYAGLIGLAPLSIAILINFGIMGAAGIKLNIGTAMIASVAVGIGIDYTIHYMAAYRHEYLITGGGDYLRRAFLTSGKAIIFNAASVGAGFIVLAFSQFNMLAYLGALIALTMGTSALVSLTVLPVLLEQFKPAFIRRPFTGTEIMQNQEKMS